MSDDAITLGGKEISPEENAEYRKRIEEAKARNPLSRLKGSEPLGGVERPQIPRLQRQAAAPGPDISVGEDRPRGVVPRATNEPRVRPETRAMIEAGVKAAAQIERENEQKKAAEDAEIQKEVEASKLFEAFDLNDFSNQAERILNNKKRRKEIEARCTPMQIDDLIMKDEVRQRVPIIPGTFEPTFRSMLPDESLYIKKLMAKEPQDSSQHYLGEMYTLLLLTCSLVDINGAPFPPHLKNTGEIDEEGFRTKFAAIKRKSTYLLADLAVNFNWFDFRVRALLNPDALGNG